MTQPLRLDILAMLHAGFSIAVIADELGLPQWDVAAWLVSSGAIRRTT